ncbi:S-layer homology domain-containing protein [Lysinibacillus sp. NPDC097287]|uniref:S-layer homology domain-containing protein n=1 Tax=Lysinibacillus sp. NPDC097287 TaxID=3364144 RepID=UPI00380AB318
MKQGKQSKYMMALAISVLAGSFVYAVPTTAASIPFTDVKNDGSEEELHKAVSDLYSKGIVFGTTSTTFSPYANLTRGEAAYFLAEALQLDVKNVENPGFKDVPTSHLYYGHIAALATGDIIQKSENYHPSNLITRSQMAKIITLGFHLEQAKKISAPFTDFTNDTETNRYIQTLVNYSITQGTSTTQFSPYTYVKRGQMTLFIYRALEKFEDDFYITGIE